MSRRWNNPNHNLPGWGAYVPPDKQRPKSKANPKRRFFRSRSKNRPRSPHPELVRPPFKPHAQARATKILRLSGETDSADCIFERIHGRWRCQAAPPPFDWFTRVNRLQSIRSWLIQNHYDFHWLSLDSRPQATATSSKPAAVTPRPPEQGTATPAHQTKQLPGPGTTNPHPVSPAENGLTTPRSLICSGCPEKPES